MDSFFSIFCWIFGLIVLIGVSTKKLFQTFEYFADGPYEGRGRWGNESKLKYHSKVALKWIVLLTVDTILIMIWVLVFSKIEMEDPNPRCQHSQCQIHAVESPTK